MSTKDFITKRVKTNALIAKSSELSSIKLMVYSDDSAGVDDIGNISETVTSGVGPDVYLFISGSKLNKKNNNLQDGNVLFGGDVISSGSIYSYFGRRLDNIENIGISSLFENIGDEIIPTNFIDGDTGMWALNIDNQSVNISEEDNVLSLFSEYTTTLRDNALDINFEYDENGDIIPK